MYKYYSLRFMADRMCDDENVKREKKDRRKENFTLNKNYAIIY